MASLFSRYATPLITGLFLVSLISGIALFFHVGMGTFHSMHEWLSMVLIIPFGFHIWKNWRPFCAYFKRAPMTIALVLSVLISIPFATPSETPNRGRGNPLVAIANVVQNGSIEQIAALYGRDTNDFAEMLREKGWSVADTSQSLKSVSAANGKSTRDVFNVLAELNTSTRD